MTLITSGCIRFEIASKSNSRRAVRFGKRPAFIKSKPALAFAAAAKLKTMTDPAKTIETNVRILTPTILDDTDLFLSCPLRIMIS